MDHARQPLVLSVHDAAEDIFYAKVSPSALSNPRWIDINEDLLEEMGLRLDIENPQTLEAFAGGSPLDEWDPTQVYSGHSLANGRASG